MEITARLVAGAGCAFSCFSRRMEQADGGIDLPTNRCVAVDAKAMGVGARYIGSQRDWEERAGGGEEV